MSRAERRRSLAINKKAILGGFDVARADRDTMVALCELIREKVSMAKRLRRLDELIEFIHRVTDAAIRKLADVPIACHEGCWACCTTWVAAKAPEIIYIWKKLSPEQRDRVGQRLDRSLQQVKGVGFDDWPMGIPCPFLEDGRCSVYASRPAVCRTMASPDAEICRRAYIDDERNDIAYPGAFMLVRSFVITATAVALSAEGLRYRGFELLNSLDAIRADPEIEQKWLAGQDVLAGRPLDPGFDDDAILNEIRLEAFGF